MSGEKYFIALALAVSLGVLGAASTAWAQSGGYDYEYEGGYVKPCSLDGVNPAYHPEIFANSAAAREYGFAQSRDGTWHTQNCPGGRDQAVSQTDERASPRAPHHHSRTALGKPSRKVAKSE
jgi:hypothetical protein